MSPNEFGMFLGVAVLKCLLLTFAVIPLGAGYVVLAERKVLGYIQARVGPNRVGPWGILQPLADAFKLLVKEDITPTHSQKIVHFLAPVIIIIPAFVLFAVIPWSYPPEMVQNATLGNNLSDWGSILGPVADVNVGLLFMVAISSIGVYGLILGGWASNNKYSLMGGLRSAAQMVSYEIPMGLAIVTVLVFAQSFRMSDIILAQYNQHLWFIFPALVAFILYFISGVAETNRSPFDLPEAETELVGGFHTEYSGMSFALFFLAEYANIVAVSSIAITLFLGGWLPLFPHGFGNPVVVQILWAIPPVAWYLGKLFFFLFVFIWLRATFPRYRFDQLMDLGWKRLIPISLINLFVVSGVVLLPGKFHPHHAFSGLFCLALLVMVLVVRYGKNWKELKLRYWAVYGGIAATLAGATALPIIKPGPEIQPWTFGVTLLIVFNLIVFFLAVWRVFRPGDRDAAPSRG